DPPIHAEGLVRAFAGTPVLAGVDLVVRGGEAVVLLGPNGAGKTTLLRILALLLRPGAGRLALFGTDAGAAPPALRRRIGYVGHESLCYPDLTAGHAIVLTTHDLERAAPVATRLAILHRGRVAWTQEGAPEPVVVAAAWQAVVVGRA